MSHVLAEEILARLGPGSFLHYGCTDARVVSALLQRGCDAYGYAEDQSPAMASLNGRIEHVLPTRAFDSVLVDAHVVRKTASLADLLRALRPLVRRNLAVESHGSATHEALEGAAIAAGFRRHPGSFPVSRYDRLNDPRAEHLTYFEIIASQALDKWPLERLLAERALHMDMTREASARSDAHVVRYALAAEWVRPGDFVLDCACGLGYGTAILAATSPGKRFLGSDIDAGCIAYARANFGHYGAEYQSASAASLGFIADHSVDMVVSFETLEHLEDYDQFIAEISRILKPDGRVIVSVPNLWVDETGRDPNPHHFHAFDYEKCRAALSRRFMVEARYAQAAPGGVKLQEAARSLERRPVQLHPAEADTEWWIVVASAHPLSQGKPVPFTHPEFDACTQGTDSAVTAFARYYDNPWIYRSWIQNGQRIRDPDVLIPAIADALPTTRPDSSDRGALLAVRAYAALQQDYFALYSTLIQQITEYLADTQEHSNPHVGRWRISLSYVAALMALGQGRREGAREFLGVAVSQDPLEFSPLIATKIVAAHFLIGTLDLVDNQPAGARQAFSKGIQAARKALHAPDVNAIGNPHQPLPFGFFELAEISDMAGQCAMAIQRLDRFPQAPAQFWRSVEAKRFGLFSWLKHLESENAALHIANTELAARSRLRTLLPLRMKEVALVTLPDLLRRLTTRAGTSK